MASGSLGAAVILPHDQLAAALPVIGHAVAVAVVVAVCLGGRGLGGNDGLDSRQGLGQAPREEQLGGLAVGFGDLG